MCYKLYTFFLSENGTCEKGLEELNALLVDWYTLVLVYITTMLQQNHGYGLI